MAIFVVFTCYIYIKDRDPAQLLRNQLDLRAAEPEGRTKRKNRELQKALANFTRVAKFHKAVM